MASGATRHSEPLGGVPALAVPSLSRVLTWESASVMRGQARRGVKAHPLASGARRPPRGDGGVREAHVFLLVDAMLVPDMAGLLAAVIIVLPLILVVAWAPPPPHTAAA